MTRAERRRGSIVKALAATFGIGILALLSIGFDLWQWLSVGLPGCPAGLPF